MPRHERNAAAGYTFSLATFVGSLIECYQWPVLVRRFDPYPVHILRGVLGDCATSFMSIRMEYHHDDAKQSIVDHNRYPQYRRHTPVPRFCPHTLRERYNDDASESHSYYSLQ